MRAAAPPSPPIPGRAPAWQRRLRRQRRILAAVLAAAVVWSVLTALRPAAPESISVLVAQHDLRPGTVLSEADLASELRPAGAVTADAVTDPGSLTGRALAFPVRQGETLTARHVISSALLEAYGPDTVATPVRLADASALEVVRAGDVVDVIGARSGDGSTGASAEVVAARVRVLSTGSSAVADGGLLGSAPASGAAGSTLVLATTTVQALDIARASVGARLSITLHRGP